MDGSSPHKVTDESSSENDWEEVIEGTEQSTETYTTPKEGVIITIPDPNARKVQKHHDDYFTRLANIELRQRQIDLHKASLLCLLARGLQMNNVLRSESLYALAISVLEKRQTIPPKNYDISYLTSFINWFVKVFTVDESKFNGFNPSDNISILEDYLTEEIESKRTCNADHLYFIFILLLRGLGIEARLIISLQPIPKKVKAQDLVKRPKEEDDEDLPIFINGKLKSGSFFYNSDSSVGSDDSDNEPIPSTSKEMTIPKKKNQKGKVTKTTKKNSPTKSSPTKSSPTKRKTGEKKKLTSDEQDNKDAIEKTESKIKVKKLQDIWAEIYMEAEEMWMSVKLDEGKIMVDNIMEAKSTQPMTYVIAFDNFGEVKDVTRRYARDWLTHTHRLRADPSWWDRSLRPYKRFCGWKAKREDELLDDTVLNASFPTSISAFKIHPFYVLPRHLLKFEAIYPPGVNHVGHFKGERIYLRDDVKELRARKTWYNLAKVVIKGEKPYKTIRAHPKATQAIRHPDYGVETIELFGEWQVEDFQPPIAFEGKVPRNEYGNVELFQPQMLPIGTTHLTHPGINGIAKKLGIDCASAISGFEYAYGKCRPIQNGHVVCEEFGELLIDAWREESQNAHKKLDEKKSKRARANWKRLIRSIFIRKRLEARCGYNLGKRALSSSGSSNEDSLAYAFQSPGKKSKRPLRKKKR